MILKNKLEMKVLEENDNEKIFTFLPYKKMID